MMMMPFVNAVYLRPTGDLHLSKGCDQKEGGDARTINRLGTLPLMRRFAVGGPNHSRSRGFTPHRSRSE